MPFRDCGDTSQQGAPTSNAYRQWINSLGAALGTKSAAIILEPDALARLDCLSAMRQAERLADLNYAVQKLATKPNLAVYLDAGHAGWLSIDMAAERLKSAGIDSATGFSLGVSHFTTAAQNAAYGQAVSRLVGGQHFIIDTSRSGRGEAGAGQWCNPPGRGLGPVPTIAPGPAGVDAYLWVKRPGESDGTCNGGPGAGQWWLDYAVALVSNS
jgi:endoglucanase